MLESSYIEKRKREANATPLSSPEIDDSTRQISKKTGNQLIRSSKNEPKRSRPLCDIDLLLLADGPSESNSEIPTKTPTKTKQTKQKSSLDELISEEVRASQMSQASIESVNLFRYD